MPTALIADDEPHLVEFLRARLAKLWPELDVVAAVENGVDALRIARERVPDIAFLDIRMPGLTGLEVARQLQEEPRRPRVVFVTAYDQYAIDAFDADAIDYLLKPVSDERLERTIDKLRATTAAAAPPPDLTRLLAQLAQHMGTQGNGSLRWIRASRRSLDGEITEQIAVADVLYFQADDKYTCVVLRDGANTRELLIRVPLSELNDQLDKRDFQQIHRSVIVNLNVVAGTRRDLAGKLFVRLRDVTRELPVARQYVHLFRQM
jgi:DNA-binding LytR/AlgR family response regulator